MKFISIVETFGAVVVALGGWEGVKWMKRSFFPSKAEKRIDESEAGKSEVEVKQAFQDLQNSINETWQKNIKDFTDIDYARIKELREANSILNRQVIDLNQQITDMLKAGARKDDIISDKVSKIRELEESRLEDTKRYEGEITTLTKRNGELEKLIMFYRAWHCEREYGDKKEDCKRRKPAQNPPLRYCPIEEKAVSNTKIPLCEVSTIVNTDVEPKIVPATETPKKTKRSKPRIHPKEFEQ